jgi:hypothetical protein
MGASPSVPVSKIYSAEATECFPSSSDPGAKFGNRFKQKKSAEVIRALW